LFSRLFPFRGGSVHVFCSAIDAHTVLEDTLARSSADPGPFFCFLGRFLPRPCLSPLSFFFLSCHFDGGCPAHYFLGRSSYQMVYFYFLVFSRCRCRDPPPPHSCGGLVVLSHLGLPLLCATVCSAPLLSSTWKTVPLISFSFGPPPLGFRTFSGASRFTMIEYFLWAHTYIFLEFFLFSSWMPCVTRADPARGCLPADQQS